MWKIENAALEKKILENDVSSMYWLLLFGCILQGIIEKDELSQESSGVQTPI